MSVSTIAIVAPTTRCKCASRTEEVARPAHHGSSLVPLCGAKTPRRVFARRLAMAGVIGNILNRDPTSRALLQYCDLYDILPNNRTSIKTIPPAWIAAHQRSACEIPKGVNAWVQCGGIM